MLSKIYYQKKNGINLELQKVFHKTISIAC